MHSIFLVEDDLRLAKLVKDFLNQNGFDVQILNSGEQAVDAIIDAEPDVAILDIMLPGLDGFSICRQLRSRFDKPIIFLTAKDSPIDHVLGLEIGADDYIIKPVDPHVLLARIQAVLRRSSLTSSDSDLQRLSFDLLHIDNLSRSVTFGDLNIELTSHEYELLWLLAQSAGHPISRNQIHETMIGREYDGLDRTVDVRVSRLRKKLGDDPKHPFRIVTVWGKGYMLCPTAWQTPLRA